MITIGDLIAEIFPADAELLTSDALLGREVTWGSHVWRVVGVFEAGGSVSESEVWTDLSVLQGVYRRGNTVQVVRAQALQRSQRTGERVSQRCLCFWTC